MLCGEMFLKGLLDMEYILGLDGGGTKTDCYIFSKDGALVSAVSGGATNHEKYPGGFDEMAPVFDGILNSTLEGAGIEACNLAAAVFGMAGIDLPSQKERMEAYLDRLGFKNHLVINDSFLGIKAACPRGYGISFVNGTGNSVGGIDRYGSRLQVGGLGPFFGDVNGATGMSGQVICAVYSMYYRCGPATSMAEKLFRLLGIDSPDKFTEAVCTKFFSNELENRDIHDKVLYAAANEGDEVALGLLKSFGEQFADSIAGCIRNLNFDENEVDVALVGSATLRARSPVMMQTCVRRVEELTGKKIRTFPLTVPPAAGALIWASELAFGAGHAASVRGRIIAGLEKRAGNTPPLNPIR